MRFKDFLLLTEAIDNYFTPKEKEKYAEQVWNILQESYKEIGGLKGSGFNSVDDMIKNIPMWKIARRGDDVKAVMMYKDKGGRKRVAIGTDGTKEAKIMLAKMIQEEYRTGRAYGEVSDKSLAFIRKQFSEKEFESFAIPAEKVQDILPNDEIIPVDKYLYKREIGGELHTKMMLGNTNAPSIKRL
jgi:hypothetical protein